MEAVEESELEIIPDIEEAEDRLELLENKFEKLIENQNLQLANINRHLEQVTNILGEMSCSLDK